ncbi:uncharacterized protein [Physcomitrium patens]|uniref:uncharacterized protein isoform X2 n=1 Tax=Physcomitrium patens TaxID=3218 RepID=UPI000D1713D3|nr:chaperone protein dnaJ GFA2, mitochondrial-like isoform X2 [Physcomitrium patens]|eukprot:XP_024361833.1 chaperone protein dnaJ GFA2, mitochondrial-like isoform X2 [Physcomitrella patens]
MARIPRHLTLKLLRRSLLAPARPAAAFPVRANSWVASGTGFFRAGHLELGFLGRAAGMEELRNESSFNFLTREAHFLSRDQFFRAGAGGCNHSYGVRIGDEWLQTTGRRGFHATGVQHMARQNFYETLGLQRGANPKEIKSAYYELAKRWHPDVNKGNAEAERKFQEIQQAYEVLKDDEKRAMYDQVGHDAFEQAAAGGAPGGGAGFGGFDETIFGDAFGGGMDEMFNGIFGGGRESRPHVQVQLDLTFREAVQGCSKAVNFQTTVRCQPCSGSGLPPGVKPQTCKTCRGRGRVVMQQAFFAFESTCSKCGGSGQMVKDHCRNCDGAGVVKGHREVRVDIPAGVESGTTLKVHGEGGEGPKGGRPGNLMLQIRVQPDKVFRREGANLYVDVPISFTHAILGGSVQVPTLTGDVLLKIRPGTQPGHKQVMRGKGVKVLNSRHYGDQYVLINVTIPTNITQRQRQLIEEFSGEEYAEPEPAVAEGSG